MNPKVQELLDSVKQLVTEIEAGESGEMSESEGMEEVTEETDKEMPEEGGAEVEIEMKPMRKKMGGGMPESLKRFTGGR